MMKKLLFFLLFAVFTMGISAQPPMKKCPTCGLSIPKCQYKGKHPKKKPTTTTPAHQQPSKPVKHQPTPQPSEPTTGTINGYDWVDLGLSVKWATKNVGASSQSDHGDYFAWGETNTKSSYKEDNSRTYKKKLDDIAGNSQYDPARSRWGSPWRLPTEWEYKELVDKCTWTWTSQGGHNGYRITSKTNGNSIFLPAAGKFYGTSLDAVGEYGFYWSSTPDESDTKWAYRRCFSLSYQDVLWGERYSGYSVRPVSE